MAVAAHALGFVSLEITGRCQLACTHCYAMSGPGGSHGSMRIDDWRRVIDEAADLNVERVQLIGGEPTLHPHFQALVLHTLGRGLDVEVYSNLARSVSPSLWALFERPRMGLATSYYSDDPIQHDAITGRSGSHARTLSNIVEALRRGIPLRAGVVAMEPGQRAREAVAQLRSLGVQQIDYDELRQLGRGVRDRAPEQVDQLCGGCGDRRIAVSSSGEVWPCPMSRWIPLGNVGQESLGRIYAASTETRRRLQAELGQFGDNDGGCTAPLCCDPHLDQK
jgi:MoaA/NifB/PqqE/SkfB family radical SAM enzyme